MKQREHIKVGDIDHYPEIDIFIPEAERLVKGQFQDKSIIGYAQKVNVAFIKTMNSLLAKENLRVL
ncbi:MAG: hypothetical protein DRI95_14285 [Bacteroidetes bacterium]|nr:MAG: hypothetical protein DRI95_14285 [Bacteroidota bacterium]